MKILGLETSCDECSAALVDNGKTILSHIVASQNEFHKPFYGVVPEIASRKHIEWITATVQACLKEAGLSINKVEAVAATYRPGLIGSLLVGLSFAKGLCLAQEIPLIGVDHIMAHLYAPHLEQDIAFPYIGLLLSGGHTIIAKVRGHDEMDVLGTTIDDACGEAFDKVAKFYDLGYPGGTAIDKLARKGNPAAFRFPNPSLHKGNHRYDISYSGLKTAAVNQLDLFWDGQSERSPENIAASFQKTAIDIIVNRVIIAARDTGINTIVAGGGVSANSYLRKTLASYKELKVIFPSPSLCTDNAAMVAGLAYHLYQKGKISPLTLNAQPRVPAFRKLYP